GKINMVLERSWNKKYEEEICLSWKKEKKYKFDKEKGNVYSIDTPPPYVNSPVHIGQAATYVFMDMFARYRRMCGYNVLFPLGLDRNGLPIEIAVEKKFDVKLTDTSREDFIKLCHKLLEEYSIASIEIFLRLGISFNSWEVGEDIGSIYLTDSQRYRGATQATFIDLWKKGLIFEDKRINNYCTGCRTTIADAEIVYEELPTIFYDVIFRVKETNEEIVITTTRPELICTCAMVIYNPEDERYFNLKNKNAITPLFEKVVPIRPHPAADITKGTGLVMMCSAGDTSDIRFFREMGLKATIAIDEEGRMNENAGFLCGLKVLDARKRIVDELDKKSLILKKEKKMHRTPICERSKDPIEFIEMSEFYVKQLEFKDIMKEIAKKLNFFSPHSRQILLDWVDSVNIDWPISRRRYYATELPIWYCEKCNKAFLPENGKYVQPWREKFDGKCECGSRAFRGEERVFDTWFDSSITPLYILGYSYAPEFFEKNSQCTLRPQGKEIVRTWLYYTLLKCYLLTNKIIFRDVWINYHIVDEKGRKLSKSLGNVIDPMEVIKIAGAEAFRLWCATEGNIEKTDLRCSIERIIAAGKTLNKLWNIAYFVSQFPNPKEFSLLQLDKWIRNEINDLIVFSKECYEKYDFHNPALKLKHFIWETFASHYIEIVKNRAYNAFGEFKKEEQDGAHATLHYVLDTILKLCAPIIPMITYKLYMELRNEDLHLGSFPEEKEKYALSFKTDELINLNSSIWKYKKERNLSLKERIKKVVLDEKFREIEMDIKKAHNIDEMEYGKGFDIIS
ncbi:MAG: valine--tRNA ligase, partial [Candidatus Thermoplasmatota archaeon]